MPELQLGAIEAKFAGIIWNHEPVSTAKLVELAEKEFRWKRTTTYTVLRRLCNKGLFVNNQGTVTALMSKKEYYARQSRQYVNETFHGSLPAFLAAFTSGKKLTAKEADELHQLIDKAGEQDD